MRVNRMSSKLIKPHTPTPQNLKNYKLSFMDEAIAPINFAVILFYQWKPENSSLQLEESLARILVEFYPLAGRFIKNYSLIDCCDEGAELVEAEALDVELIDLAAKINVDQLDNLLPYKHSRQHEAPDNPILLIQITRFSCGGAAIAISVSHKIFDGPSLDTFVDAWAAATNPDDDKRVISPSFHLPSLLPSMIRNDNPAVDLPSSFQSTHKVVLKRLLFNKEALRRLKSRIRQTNGKPVSGVRVVSAVMAKALFRLDRTIHGRSRSSVVFQGVNMRGRSIPPQSTHTCGNFSIPAMAGPIEAADEVDLNELVRLLGDSVRNCIARHAETILSPDRDGRDILANTYENYSRHICDPQTNALIISDLSSFGFHKADFGWGKPASTILPLSQPISNYVLLMGDKSGDGIAAYLYLNQHEVPYFEQDVEIKPFISYYPSRL